MRAVRRILKYLGLSVVAVVIAGAATAVYFWPQSIPLDAPETYPTESRIADDRYVQAVEKARLVVDELMAGNVVPGMSVAVGHEGRIVWTEARGYADLADRRSVTTDSRFLIGSVSKTLTAAGALRLAERGVLDLDADVRRYVPSFPDKSHPVTMRHLLSHQGGIRHYRLHFNPDAPLIPTETALNVQFDSVTDGLSVFADDDLLFAPDTGFEYSTFGYSLASAAIEGAAGGDFLAVMDEVVFAPLGMDDTVADRSRPLAERRVRDYVAFPGTQRVLPAPVSNRSVKWAGGGFLSTPTDLVRFANGLMTGELIGPDRFEEMITPRTLTDGRPNPQHYALGWRAFAISFPRGSERELLIPNHGGTSVGSQAALLIVPDVGISVAIALNAYIGGSDPVVQAAADIARAFDAEIEEAGATKTEITESETILSLLEKNAL